MARLNVADIHNDFSVESADGKRDLEGLAKLNVFVGPNNSGKSRFLRELARLPKPIFIPTRDLSGFRKIRSELENELAQIIKPPILEVADYKAKSATLPTFDYVTAGEDPFTPFIQFLDRLAATTNPSITSHNFGGSSHGINTKLCHLGDRLSVEAKKLAKDIPTRWQLEVIYIPTLRGLRPFPSAGDCYKDRTKADYFAKEQHIQIESGLALYRQIRSLLLGTLEDRMVVNAFQKWLGQTFFDGAEVALIPREIKESQDEILYVKIGKEEEHPVYGLGDGIQMIICIMFPLFRASLNRADTTKHVLIFIEEPELYLHPGLQRTLCQALASFDRVQCFLATHSNHILDLTLDRTDMAIYSVSKTLVETGGLQLKAKSTVQLRSSHDTPILHALGVRNSSVFLSNCTIWVEGITDRRYLRKYLRFYFCHKYGLPVDDTSKLPFKEDLHYSFVEYGGANITHWSFLDGTPDPIVVDRLCGRLLLIADKDNAPSKDARHQKLKDRLKERFIVHARREIENLLPATALRSTIAVYEKASDHIPAIDYASYADVGLGKYIDDLLGAGKKREGSYAEESGTLTDKIKFCDRALEQLSKWEDLSEDAQKLAETIAIFIAEHNRS